MAPHANRRVVLHFDLRHFFPSIPVSRVHALFRTAGYPQLVARLLTGLCTNAVPEEILLARPVRSGPLDNDDRRFLSPHLPQGAPTSPALANLCAYRLDCRLEGLGRALGACYTRMRTTWVSRATNGSSAAQRASRPRVPDRPGGRFRGQHAQVPFHARA